MIKDYYFMYDKLPDPLSNKENVELLKLAVAGDSNAMDKLTAHNIRLVFHVVASKFNNTPFEDDELISAGLVGLVNAIYSFGVHKNVYFSTYAYTCIRNSILNFIRDNQQIPIPILDAPINEEEGDIITFKDLLVDSNYSIEENFIDKESYQDIIHCIDELEDINKLIVSLYFGINGSAYSQSEIAKMLNYEVTWISRNLKDSLKKIKNKLVKKGYPKSSIRFDDRKYVRI